jgi:hypothetical protein
MKRLLFIGIMLAATQSWGHDTVKVRVTKAEYLDCEIKNITADRDKETEGILILKQCEARLDDLINAAARSDTEILRALQESIENNLSSSNPTTELFGRKMKAKLQAAQDGAFEKAIEAPDSK